MINRIIIVASLFFVCCNSETKPIKKSDCKILKKYYKNNTISYKGRICNGKKHGEHVWFYKNGFKEIESNYEHGHLNGRNIFYNNLGDTIGIENYVNGQLRGESKYFNYQDSIIEVIEKVKVYNQDETIPNQWKVYDLNRSLILDKSNFVEILNKKSTYIHNTEDTIIVFLKAPFFNKRMSVSCGEFDSLFAPNKSIEIVTYESDTNFKVMLKVPTEKKGANSLRFIVNDYKEVLDTLTNEVSRDVKPIYYEYNYLVK